MGCHPNLSTHFTENHRYYRTILEIITLYRAILVKYASISGGTPHSSSIFHEYHGIMAQYLLIIMIFGLNITQSQLIITRLPHIMFTNLTILRIISQSYVNIATQSWYSWHYWVRLGGTPSIISLNSRISWHYRTISRKYHVITAQFSATSSIMLTNLTLLGHNHLKLRPTSSMELNLAHIISDLQHNIASNHRYNIKLCYKTST